MTDAAITPRAIMSIGFVGLGVMGGPMCANLVQRGGWPVVAFDIDAGRMAEAAVAGARTATGLDGLARAADVVILSLPDGAAVEQVVATLAPHLAAGATIIDTSTAPVALTRRLGAEMAARGLVFVDAPVARTREAARRGELSIMVGAMPAHFAHVQPILATMGSDVTLCGETGAGQAVKILNNMLLFMNVAAIAEAMAIGRRSGVALDVLLATIAKGSGDSFALRNHALKSMLPREFPERAFSTRYAIKDLGYALELGAAAGLDLKGAKLTMRRLLASDAAGNGERYFPALLEITDPALGAPAPSQHRKSPGTNGG